MTDTKHTLANQLRDEAQRLSGHSIDRGCANSGIASNLADQAADTIDDLIEALQEITHYAECQIEAFKSGRPYLDMTAFILLCPKARAAIAKATGAA